MQQLLDQSQRTEPAADRAAQNSAEQQENAHHVPPGSVAGRGQRILQCPERAGTDSPGAGITVEARDTGILCLALINLAVNEAPQVRIVEQRAVELDQFSGRWPTVLPPICFYIINIIIQGRYTPYKS